MPRSIINRGGIEAGRRDKHIALEQVIDENANSNFPTERWVNLSSAWASREYVTLDERTEGSQLIASATSRWTIPYMESMDPDRIDVPKKRRLVYLGRVYPILAAELLSRQDGLAIVLVTKAQV